MTDSTIVSITSFEPLSIVFPNVEMYTGDIFLAFPAVHVKLYDLSMGGIIPGQPHIGGDGQIFGFTLHLGTNSMTHGDIIELIRVSKAHLIEMHRIVQQTLDKHGALL